MYLTKSRIIHFISRLLCIMIVFNFLPVAVSATAEIANPARVEIFLAADPASNNLSLDGFEDQLKNDISGRYGYPPDKISVTSVESQSLDASTIDWYEFDHTNNISLAESTPTSLIVYDAEMYGNLVRDKHIVFSDGGSTIDFYGYGEEGYDDFLYTPDSNANNKVFTFTMNEAAVSYHTLRYGGFLFNASYSYNESTGERLVSGYVVAMAETTISLYQITNVSVADLMAGTAEPIYYLFSQEEWDSYLGMGYTEEELHSYGYYLIGTEPISETYKRLATVTKPSSVSGYRYLKLVASPTRVSLYQFTDNTYATTTEGGKIFENVSLPVNYGAFGYGPFAAYNSHGCSQLTQLTFSSLNISTNTSTSFTDLVRSIDWKYEDSLKIIINVDNDGVPEFGEPADLGTILYYTGMNNAHYIGWGINNTISIGSETTVIGQAGSFIARNTGKGTTINRSEADHDSLAEGITVIADYIFDQYGGLPQIDKPHTSLTFNTDGSIRIDVTDTETSAGNPIGAYEWRYMDIADGSWHTSGSTGSGTDFTFGSGTYNMVTVKIQDAVSGFWSDYTIAYIANDSSVPPIAQFSLSQNELMPDCSVESIKTTWTVTSSDYSYHPAGEALTAWEWKVFDSTLTAVPSMASSEQEPTFDFSGKAAGTYTIQLRVKKGSIWSAAYTQQVVLYLESSSITVSKTSPAGSGPFHIASGGTTFGFAIESTGANLARYRVIRSPLDGSAAAADGWKLASGKTAADSSTVSSSSIIYVQALDAQGNSKIGLIGTFYRDSLKPVLSVDSHGYAPGNWTNQTVTLDLKNSTYCYQPITQEYKINSGSWTSFGGQLIIADAGTYTVQFRATTADNAQSDVLTVSVKIDKTAPALTGTSTDASGIENKLVLQITAGDQDSGLWKIATKAGSAAAKETDVAAGKTDPVKTASVSCEVPVNGLARADFAVQVTITDKAGNSAASSVNVLANVVKAKIDSLPDPDSATDQDISDHALEIKEAKRLYDLANESDRDAIGSDRSTKLEKLLERLSTLIIIIKNDPVGSNNTGPDAFIENIGTSVVIPELANSGVSKVTIKVNIEEASAQSLGARYSIAAGLLEAEQQHLLQMFNISLLKIVRNSNGQETTTTVSNDDIKDYMTVLLPVSSSYLNRPNLHIVYISDAGQIEHLDTTIVTIEGQTYLQFLTNHFSTYGLAAGDAEDIVTTGEKQPVLPLILILCGIAVLLLVRVGVKRAYKRKQQ